MHKQLDLQVKIKNVGICGSLNLKTNKEYILTSISSFK
jgi:hypothetical protein